MGRVLINDIKRDPVILRALQRRAADTDRSIAGLMRSIIVGLEPPIAENELREAMEYLKSEKDGVADGD